MLRHTSVFAATVILAQAVLGLDVPSEPASMAGSWQVDSRRSDAQLVTDATTDYGKTKMNVTLGFARVNGILRIDDNDPTKSSVDLTIYPAASISPSIDEDGMFLSDEAASRSTLVSFRSKRVLRAPGGKWQATGNLTLIRVDRNIETTAPSEGLSEAHVDPPPLIHRTSHEVTFIFDVPAAAENEQKGGVQVSGSTTVSRENFSQMVSTAISTYWPPLIQDENCELPIASELNGASQCTRTFLKTPGLPEAPRAANGKDLHGPENFNALVGEHLTVLVHMCLMLKGSGEQPAAEN
jgi:polyisoprenoid-binding protein YceI